MLGLDRAGDFLEAIAALEPKKIKSDKFQYPKSLSDPDWDGSISINTYTDYSTLYGPFTVHTYHEEWDSGTDIYATDADTGKDLMGYIVQCMRASGRYRGELFDARRRRRARGQRAPPRNGRGRGRLRRVPCPSGDAASTASRRCSHAGFGLLSRKYCEGPRRRYGHIVIYGMMTEVGSGRDARRLGLIRQGRLIMSRVYARPVIPSSLSGTKIDFLHKGHVALTASTVHAVRMEDVRAG